MLTRNRLGTALAGMAALLALALPARADGIFNPGSSSGSSSIISGTTPCTGCASGGVLFNNGGVVTADAGLTKVAGATGAIGIGGTVTFADTSTWSASGIALVAPQTILISGTITTVASGALNNTSTGNITVGNTAGWPVTGTMKVVSDRTVEYMSFAVVNMTTLNITARGTYGSVAASHAGTPTIAYARKIIAPSTSAIPHLISFSDGSTGFEGFTDSHTNSQPQIYFGTNQTSGFGQNSGAAPYVEVNEATQAIFLNGIQLPSLLQLNWNTDAILTRQGLANVQFGAANVNGAPVAQTVSFQSALAGSATNQASANTTLIGSLGTGTGTNGNTIFQVGVKTTTGTAQATATTALTLTGETLVANFAGSITAVLANTATTSAVCYNTGTGVLTYDGTVGTCTVSGRQFKNILSSMDSVSLASLHPTVYRYKPESGFDDGRVHVGLLAQDVAKMDDRCGVRNVEGEIINYEDRCVLAHLVAEIESLRRSIR